MVFHNLKNYDMHSLCILGFSKMPEWGLDPIATTAEKYLTLPVRVPVGKQNNGEDIIFTVRFIDSYQFLTSSLDNLAKSLSTEEKVNSSSLLKSNSLLERKQFSVKAFFHIPSWIMNPSFFTSAFRHYQTSTIHYRIQITHPNQTMLGH